MIWWLVQLLSSAPGSDDAEEPRRESYTNTEQALCVCVFFKNACRTRTSAFQDVVRTRRSIKMVAASLMHISMNNFSSLLLGFVSDTYCISACISTCCFQILFLCQILLKTGIMMVYATFSLTQHLPLFKY